MSFRRAFIYLLLFLAACKRDKHENLSGHLTSFYKYYIIEEFKNDRKVSVDTLKKYFTNRFLSSKDAEAEKCDCDPVIQSQDYNEKMLETLSVEFKAKRRNALYFDLNFIDEFDNSKHGSVLMLKMEHEVWKIDTIVNNDNQLFVVPE